MIAVACKSQRR